MAVYAVSDLHGRYDLFQKIKDFIQPEDIVYVLGDCADRGKDGWAIIKEVYENPQFIFIRGNHEDMLLNAMKGDKGLHRMNGGKSTYEKWKYKDGADRGWIFKLAKLPYEEIYLNKRGQRIVLCHAGYTPHIEGIVTPFDMVWDRYHFNDMWDMDYVDTFMIHGHTPIPCMDEFVYSMPYDIETDENDVPGAYWYSPDDEGIFHKCNIDCGAFFTGRTVLLNLDTFKQHIFMAEDCVYKNEE